MSSKSTTPADPRVKQFLIGSGGIFVVFLIAGLIWYGRSLPGFAGECFALVAGIITTPFLMEASFIILGLLLVMLLNYWRLRRDGDEFVYLDQAEGPGSESLPDSARWAIYDNPPLDPVNPDLLARAEGALEIGDHEGAVEALASMTDSERESPPVLEFRIALARASGKEELAKRLEAKLAEWDQRRL